MLFTIAFKPLLFLTYHRPANLCSVHNELFYVECRVFYHCIDMGGVQPQRPGEVGVYIIITNDFSEIAE